MIRLERISPDNALVFKTVRLRALEESPSAFGSTFARELQLSDEDWHQRSLRWISDGSIGYLAFDADCACGLVVCYREERAAHSGLESGHVLSMWVDPGYRRAGVGKTLIEALEEWGRSHGLGQLRLMVTSVNIGAIGFYERLGFCRTGKTEPYPNDPAIVEYEMILPLRA
jgi:ribosomal protein S18 acetylase RimI-like enzyme